MLPLSHDEVVHLKRSLLGKMPGDEWQQFANLRLRTTASCATHPGKKLLFMGGEFAPATTSGSYERGLDWHLLAEPRHAGHAARWSRDCNRLYRELHRAPRAATASGPASSGSTHDNAEQTRLLVHPQGRAIRTTTSSSAANFTPVVRHGFRLGVPAAGAYREMLNTDAAAYGGGGEVNEGRRSRPNRSPRTGHAQSLAAHLPPLATIVSQPA